MAGMDTRGRRDPAPASADFKFVVGTVIAAIAMIALSLATNVPTVWGVQILVAP